MSRPFLFLFPAALVILPVAAAQAHQAHDGCRTYEEGDVQPDCRNWEILYSNIDGLPQEKQDKAREIVQESLPGLQSIEKRIALKMNELNDITYSTSADADSLPRLGMDLQKLRNELATAIMQVNIRLQKEAGVSMQKPAGRGCRSMRTVSHHEE